MFKKIISLVVVSVLVFGTVCAQHGAGKFENKTPEEVAKFKTERLNQKLSLSDEQTVAVYDIFLGAASKREKLQDEFPQVALAKEEMQSYRKENKSEVQKILTSEQMAKQKKMRKGEGHKMKKGNNLNSMSFETKLERMKADLDLSDKQVTELKSVFEKAQSQRDLIKEKYPELEMARTEMKANKAQTDGSLKKVLTDEQFEMYKAHGPKNGKKGKR